MNSRENNQKILFNNKYEQVRLLGEGSFGKAFLVESVEDRVIHLYFIKINDLRIWQIKINVHKTFLF